MIKQLAERAAVMIQQAGNRAREESQFEVEEEILDCLLGTGEIAPTKAIREQFRTLLRKGELEDTNILIKLKPRTPSISNGREIIVRVDELFGTSKAVRVQDARKILTMQLEDQDNKDFNNDVVQLTEQYGIVFIDEIDKVVRSNADSSAKGDASDRGVQSDLLPILEGTQISTKYGSVRTDHILFIASGAFHKVKVSDMMSELQGRLPVRVKLNAIDEASMYRVLTEPVSSIVKQYTALLETEGITLVFTECGLRELARGTCCTDEFDLF
jgi:ATP-dependent HslUV protease ATP-binding subunit HslU